MTAVALLTELRDRGATVAVSGDRVRIDAPKGAVTPELRTAVAVHKTELLAMLSGSDETERCEHVAGDPDLAEWYRQNPHLTCARCWLAGKPLAWLQ